MSLHANLIARAIVTRLEASAALLALIGPNAIRDHAARNSVIPHVVIGPVETSDWSSQTSHGEEHLFSILTAAKSRRQANDMAALLESLLDGADLPMTGVVLIDCAWRSTRHSQDGRTGLAQAEIRFRAITEDG